MPKILFTGGGTAGHVTPNLALIEKFQQQQWEIMYIGSNSGLEKTIIERINISYFAVPTAKLRRELSWSNLITPFKVMSGIIAAYKHCKTQKPQAVFSKGGFVAFPVVVGAWLNRIPVIIHESDLTPGLANRLSFPFSQHIFVNFNAALKNFKNTKKVSVSGTPVRSELLRGDANKGRALCQFDSQKPVLLVMGGGQGSELINKVIRAALPELLPQFDIIHICGKGKINQDKININGYKQFEYVNEELGDLLACANLVVSRAGANSIYELLTLHKRHILIPLAKASRGDQIQNARYFEKQGISLVINENEFSVETLLATIRTSQTTDEQFKQQLTQLELPNSVEVIYQLINSIVTGNEMKISSLSNG